MPTFLQVDVFGARPLAGNPVAVILDADDLSSAQMQDIARWTNLSETTFVMPATVAGADYRVRIFTPGEELPFAGHPTLGTCHAWVRQNPVHGRDVVQQCGAGLVRVRQGEQLAFAAPPVIRSGPVDRADLARLVQVLDLTGEAIVDAAWVDNGPGWVAVRVKDAEVLRAIAPTDLDGYFVGVVAGVDEGVEVRAFFTANGVCAEDPVTGSLNASLAPWLVGSGVVDYPFVARQGGSIGRDGRVFVSRDEHGTVWVGGATVTVVEGTLTV